MGSLRIAGLCFAVGAVVLWMLSALATWAGVDRAAVSIEANAAAAASVLAGLCLIAFRVRDRDKDVLVDAMADLSLRRAMSQTRPDLQRLRRVS